MNNQEIIEEARNINECDLGYLMPYPEEQEEIDEILAELEFDDEE